MTPTLHLISGMIGAGKTTLAVQLAARTGALRLSPDEGIKAMASDPADRREADALRDRIEALQWQIAMRVLRAGEDVILENGFWFRDERLRYLSEARGVGAAVELHFLDVALDELQARVARRNLDPDMTSFHVEPEEVRRWFFRLEKPLADEVERYDSFVRY